MRRAAMLRLSVELVRFILGVVFVVSALLKAVDPYGVSYKVYEYFNTILGYGAVEFRTASMALAVALCFVEFILGSCLLMGIYRRLASKLVVMMQIFFTVLTAYTYFFAPIKECGCFGDALKMTDGETLLKNIVLLLLAIYLMRYARRARTLFSRMERWFFSFLAVVGILVFMYANVRYLPYIDFRSYKVGVNLKEQRQRAEDDYLNQLLTNTYYLYAKDGQQVRFRADSLPDSTWSYVETIESKELTPAVNASAFDLYDVHGRLATDDIFNDTAGVFLVLSSSWQDASVEHSEVLNELYDYAHRHGYQFYGVSSSSFEEIAEWRYQTGAEYDMLTMDATTVRTIIRSNPGLLIMKGGQVMSKLSMNMLPRIEDIPNFVKQNLSEPQTPTYAQWRVVPLGIWLLGYLVGVLRLWSRLTSALFFLKRRGKRSQTIEKQ